MIDKISVVIITRNREKMLKGCLLSLVKQTRLPDEVVIVDNASSDNTKKIILSFKKTLPIKYILEKQVGRPYARNKGIQEALGTLILMLDDDCVADRFWVGRMVSAHKKYPKAWVIQGRTFSLPKRKLYSVVAEFYRFLYLRKYVKRIIPVKSYFTKNFRDEMEISTCDTKNFSIKTAYLKKHKLSFDEDFYRGVGEDTDFGKQIMQKNGLIMFCPSIQLAHWERANLKEFLEQRWHVARASARIVDKWKTPVTANVAWSIKFITFFLFCKVFNQWYRLPIFITLHFLNKLYLLNGYFFEKRILSLEKRV